MSEAEFELMRYLWWIYCKGKMANKESTATGMADSD